MVDLRISSIIDKSIRKLLPNSLQDLTSIASYRFSDCKNLIELYLPNTLTNISGYAFKGCTGLKTLNIPDSVTYIGASAFYECTSLTSITMGSGITQISSSAFGGLNSLNALHIKDLTAWCLIAFSNGLANPMVYAKQTYVNGELLTNLTIPSGITRIGSYQFDNCRSITSLNIPDNVTSIEREAFAFCENLTSITLGKGVENIGMWAFEAVHCTSINYTGTVAQWEAIVKDESWCSYSSITTINCSDGTVTL